MKREVPKAFVRTPGGAQQQTQDRLTFDAQSYKMADGARRRAVVRATFIHAVAETRYVAETDRLPANQRDVT